VRPFKPGSARRVLLAARATQQEKNTKSRPMTWTLTNFLIELVAGHAIAAVAKERSFGVLGHTIDGALGGAFSGYFLQTLAALVVDSTGAINQDADQVTQWFIQAVTGLVAGAIVTMALGFARQAFEQQKLGRG
jgi:hypothetical protein